MTLGRTGTVRTMARISAASYKPKKRKRIMCPEITEYMRLVETGKVRSCERQKKLCKYVRKVFAEEELIIDTKRIDNYGNLLAFFPFDKLFPWEWFLLTLFLCVFKADGTPRWNKLICFIGRGAGKTGFIAFIAFCVMTKINGIANYDVDVIANTEKQAMRSFKAVYSVLEKNRSKWKNKTFDWNKKEIKSLTTDSEMHALTSNSGGLDGLASGLFICDEVHYMASYTNITTLKTGQGKCAHPRRAYISSNGNVREGVFDRELERCDKILDGLTSDNGYLPFVCMLDDPNEVHDPRNWEKANPSLPYDVTLYEQTRDDYNDWLEDPASNPDFMTKRMGCPQGDVEHEITSRENLMRASRELPDLRDWSCVLGLDASAKNDFFSAVLLFREGDKYYAIHHSWFCLNSVDKPRIKAPLEDWENLGIVTLVDDVEIHTSLVMDWIREAQKAYDIQAVAIDLFRYDRIHEELNKLGYDANDGSVVMVRPSDHARVHPTIHSVFVTGNLAWGNDPAMRWFTNNTKIVPWMNGNFKFEKIEPKGRKTDGFFALAAAFRIADKIPECSDYELSEPIVF